MNIGGHIAVAMRLAPDEPRMWLGAALPDLGAMGRFRLMGDTPDPEVAAGIALHHATDDAFHRHPTFTEAMARLRAALATDGVGRGPARAVAHVGPELLIDGCLLRDEQIGAAVFCRLCRDRTARPRSCDLGRDFRRRLASPPCQGSRPGVFRPTTPTHTPSPSGYTGFSRIGPASDSTPITWRPLVHRLEAEQGALDQAVPALLDDLEQSLR